MRKNGILTLLFSFVPGAGQMYQGYMKRGLSLITLCCGGFLLGMLFEPLLITLLVVWMYSFFDTFNLRAQITTETAPADDYLFHLSGQDQRLQLLLTARHKLVGWALIALGALIFYQEFLLNILGNLLWKLGRESAFFYALYHALDALPQLAVCVVLILVGVWLVRGPRSASHTDGPDTTPPEDYREYGCRPETPEPEDLPESLASLLRQGPSQSPDAEDDAREVTSHDE